MSKEMVELYQAKIKQWAWISYELLRVEYE